MLACQILRLVKKATAQQLTMIATLTLILDQARAEILQLNLRSIDTDPSIDINELADITEGYSGAEIVDICQTAGYVALEKGVETGIKVGLIEALVLVCPRIEMLIANSKG